jgi:biopolymer transport protein ExbD
MRIRARNVPPADRAPSMLTALIDVVFLLLVFFVMTFRIVAPEGDFDVGQTAGAAPVAEEIALLESLPVRVRLRADAEGRLAGVELGDRRLADLAELRGAIRALCAAGEPEVVLDCDSGLRFEHTVAALDAVTGYVERGRAVRMTGRVRFTPPARTPNP